MIKYKFNSFDILLIVAITVFIFTSVAGVTVAKGTAPLDIEYKIEAKNAPLFIADKFTAGIALYGSDGNQIGTVKEVAVSENADSCDITFTLSAKAIDHRDSITIGTQPVAVGHKIYFSSDSACAEGVCTEIEYRKK